MDGTVAGKKRFVSSSSQPPRSRFTDYFTSYDVLMENTSQALSSFLIYCNGGLILIEGILYKLECLLLIFPLCKMRSILFSLFFYLRFKERPVWFRMICQRSMRIKSRLTKSPLTNEGSPEL